jgi:hypothetical protein
MYGGDVTIGPREAGLGWIVEVVLDVPSSTAPTVSGDRLP